MTDQPGLSYCADMVRRLDKDRFLTALFAPEPVRSRLMALYAFNLEVARTRENVSEPMIGEIRLQWWRDALDAIYKGTPPEHEVVQALTNAIEAADLDRAPLDRLIDARTFDLYDEPMKTRRELEAYLKDTSSSLMQAGAALTAPKLHVDQQVFDAAGIGWGIFGLLRALPIHIQRHQQFVPQEILDRHGVLWADFESGGGLSKIDPVISELKSWGVDALAATRKSAARVPRTVRPVFLPASLAWLYLKDLDRPDFNPCKEMSEVPVYRKQITLVARFLFGRI